MKRLLALTALIAMPGAAQAQATGLPAIVSVPARSEQGAIPLNTGGVADGARAETWFAFGGGSDKIVRNVTRATLTPVLPDPAKANGAAIIVAPGGGFMMLSMDSEGWATARWLADHGIAAFVLKYRLRPTAADNAAFGEALGAQLTRSASGPRPPEVTTPEYAVADVKAAMALVRARATQWKVDPKRVGLIGFSAGAMAVLGATLQSSPEEMPAFTAPIYPIMSAVTVPKTAPPLFVSLAVDDPLVGRGGYGIVDSWRVAGKPVELHVFQNGGHGYGLGRPGTAAAGWIETFYRWLDYNKFLSNKAQ